MKKYVLIFFIFFSLNGYAQIQNTWMTGHALNLLYPKGGIDFSNGTADTFPVFRRMGFFAINTMMNDTMGNLLFYSNGNYIANANHDTLLNSKDFNPGYATNASMTWGLNLTQSVLILPFPDYLQKYIVFHCSAERFLVK